MDEHRDRLPLLFDAGHGLPHGGFTGDVAGNKAKRRAAIAHVALEIFGITSRPCQRCHGTEGRSDKGRPNIAGQPSEYVARTLAIYGELRTGRLDPEKLAATKELSSTDIKAVSAYIAYLR